MTHKEYTDWVETKHAQFDLGMQRINAGLGLAGESGEVANLVKKGVIYQMGFNHANVTEELGDLFFYMTWLMATFKITLDDVMMNNVLKLDYRYPQGWVPGGGIR